MTGCLQGCLLVMAILFELRERRERRLPAATDHGVANGYVNGEEEIDERTRLLRHEH